jgi:FeS assembly protein IscX
LEAINRKLPALYWDSTYAIAVALIDAYPEKDPDEVGLHELADIVPTLQGFKDFPELANERILIDIQIAWYEELTNE